MADEKLQISWDDLGSAQVEQKLKAQEAVSATQAHYEATNVNMPEQKRRFGFLYHAVIYLSLFGALGGLLGWGFGEILHFRENPQTQARDLIQQYDRIVRDAKKIQATDAELAQRTSYINRIGKRNPYFQIYVDPKTDDAEKAQLTDEQLQADQWRDFIANLLFYGVSGVMIAVMLAVADSVMERNINGAIIYGSIGAVVGLAGGIVVALLVNRIEQQMMPMQEVASYQKRMMTYALCWGLLGLFLAAAPGIILRNSKRLLIGMAGGLIGGVIGGLLFVPIEEATNNQHVSRLVAITCIGLLAGLFSGVIENVVKAGWFKVQAGLIAGKQFVLYRNPTFIGSHPMSHIYLFNDPHVGKRHACVHIVGNAYEIEDLPLGTRTYVNEKPVARQRLHNGDVVRVGATVFQFQEKSKNI